MDNAKTCEFCGVRFEALEGHDLGTEGWACPRCLPGDASHTAARDRLRARRERRSACLLLIIAVVAFWGATIALAWAWLGGGSSSSEGAPAAIEGQRR